MFGMSLAEITIIMIVILVVLGPEKIPEVARTAGKTMREIRRAGNMLRDAIMLEDDKRTRPKPTYTPPKRELAQETSGDKPSTPASHEHEDWHDPYGSSSHVDEPSLEGALEIPMHSQRPTRSEDATEVALSSRAIPTAAEDAHPSTSEVYLHERAS